VTEDEGALRGVFFEVIKCSYFGRKLSGGLEQQRADIVLTSSNTPAA
jgi:hypothetical protein